ncbi:hypothetical protein V1520DRAFT_342764 [Lipomyces starkeyi]|uniref:Uncharacterized protein n=1 Tax=Lipomyces starkeyi NRRL Y-11557 TaxID=675824 RepID=A0A1E3QCE6_LIPST|nr:hypothetical protein LIPSTDRAFT_25226 [Lipomyces starkeyi NRRL Y-11557]
MPQGRICLLAQLMKVIWSILSPSTIASNPETLVPVYLVVMYFDMLHSPFGIRVMHRVTGVVRTNIFDLMEKPNLPHLSMRHSASPFYNYLEGKLVEGKETSTETYAKSLVNTLLKRKLSHWNREGAFSGITWFASTFLWKGALDGQMRKIAGFDRVKRRNIQ